MRVLTHVRGGRSLIRRVCGGGGGSSDMPLVLCISYGYVVKYETDFHTVMYILFSPHRSARCERMEELMS